MTEDALARSMFLVLHDPFWGKPSAPPELLRYALVMAALADLTLRKRIAVENRRITATGTHGDSTHGDDTHGDDTGQDTDDVDALLLGAIPPPGAYITRSWVESFTHLVYEMVAQELVAGGVVRREQGRGLLRRRPDRFPAADLLQAAGPRVRFEHMMRSPHDMDLIGATFAGIFHGLGIENALNADLDRATVRHNASAAARQLPADLRSLLEAVTTAVAEVTLTFHRL